MQVEHNERHCANGDELAQSGAVSTSLNVLILLPERAAVSVELEPISAD